MRIMDGSSDLCSSDRWARLHDVAPYFIKHVCLESAGNLPPWEAGTYPYPTVMNYVDDDADKAYAMTKAMFDQFPNYKDAAPAATGYALDKQVLTWVVPFHEGAIRYYKEVGKWTSEIQAHNDALIERQGVLKKAWEGLVSGDAPSNAVEF